MAAMCLLRMATTVAMWSVLLLSVSRAAVARPLESSDDGGIRELNFFLQENPDTSTFVVQPQDGHEGNYGALVIINQAVTVDPSNTSLEIGKGRGLAAFAGDGAPGAPEILWTIILNDTRDGGYGQGSLSFRGSNDFSQDQRELAIVGGTGAYRFVSGFAYHVTYARDSVTRYTTSNITVFVQENAAYQTYLRVKASGRLSRS